MVTIELIAKIAAIAAACVTVITAAVKVTRKCKEKAKERAKYEHDVRDGLSKLDYLSTEMPKLKKQLVDMDEKLSSMSEDVANIEGELLTQAHEELTAKGWCSPERKAALQTRYESYHKKGYNHLKETYMDDIFGLPEHKPVAVPEVVVPKTPKTPKTPKKKT